MQWIELTMRGLMLTSLLSVVAITSCQAQDVLELSLTRDRQRLSREVDKGQVISLRCDMIWTDQVFPPFAYNWREEDTFTDLATTAKYNIIADSDFNYQCRARAVSFKGRPVQARGTISLTVRDPPVIATPDQPSITDDGIEYMVGFNDTCINNTIMGMVNFTCVVVSGRRPLTISWQVGDENFTSDGRSMVVTINDTVSKLVIGVDTGASLDLDLNEYRCTAINSDGTDTAVSTLSRCETVPVIEEVIRVTEHSPSQGNIGGNFSNFIGEQVVINCTLIDGFPLPNISWFRKDTELIMLRNSSDIVITVDPDTIGAYTCVATNILGSDSATSFVDIKVIVLSLTRPGQRMSATVDKGQIVALDCSMVFTDQVFSPFSYSWSEGGMSIKLSNMARYVVTADSDFTYQCVVTATDQKGRPLQARGSIDITVRVPCSIEGQFYSDNCEGANATCSDPNSKIFCDVPQCVCPRGQVIDTVANVCINGTECSNACKIKRISGKLKYRNNRRRLILTFSSNRQGKEASFVCQIDDQQFEPCTSPVKWRNLDLESGEHSVTVSGSCIYNDVETSSITREFSFQVRN